MQDRPHRVFSESRHPLFCIAEYDDMLRSAIQHAINVFYSSGVLGQGKPWPLGERWEKSGDFVPSFAPFFEMGMSMGYVGSGY